MQESDTKNILKTYYIYILLIILAADWGGKHILWNITEDKGVSSLHPLCGPKGLNSAHQAWVQDSLSSESSCIA